MPGFDRTRTEEQGSHTGSPLGICSNNENSLSGQEPQMGQGLGRGMGRGAGIAANRALRRGPGRELRKGPGRNAYWN